jgi:hypothetical protein
MGVSPFGFSAFVCLFMYLFIYLLRRPFDNFHILGSFDYHWSRHGGHSSQGGHCLLVIQGDHGKHGSTNEQRENGSFTET